MSRTYNALGRYTEKPDFFIEKLIPVKSAYQQLETKKTELNCAQKSPLGFIALAKVLQ